ncbi:MAG TPA: hypothetical protein VKS21_08130, partial [Spirochaetota bacterium]|nr:hypothetical protein [Spirochaetota bacterium]
AAAGKRSSARKAQTESDSKDRASVDNTEDDPFNDEAEFNEADTGDDNEIKKEEPESEKAGRESDTDAGTDENEASELETTIELSDDNSDPNDTETDLTEEKASESVENSKADSDHISAPAASNESEMVEEELTAQPEDTSPPAEQDEAAEKESSEETEAAAAPESAAQSSMENDAQEDETEFKQNINTGAEEQTEQTASLSAENEQNSSNSTEEDKNNEKENSDKNENDTVSLQSNFENDLKNELVDNVQQTQSSTDNSEPSAAAPSSDEKQKSRKPFYIIMISSVFILIFMAVFFADYYAQWNIIERLFPAGWSWWDDGYKGPLDQNFLDKSGADNVYGTPAGRKVHRGELKRKNALITTNYNKAASRETSAAKKTDQTAIPTGKRVYIEWGQTLTAIAAREYNNADFWPYIYYNNIKTLQSPDELVPVRDRIVLTYRTNANLGDLYFRLFIYYKKLSSRKKYAMLKKAYLYNSGRLESERDQISATEKKFLNRLK